MEVVREGLSTAIRPPDSGWANARRDARGRQHGEQAGRLVHHDHVLIPVSPVGLLLAAGVAIVIGLAAGVYPALRTSRLTPVDAIRAG